MQKVYRIKDWQLHFENNKSRERDLCSWCPMPNKQDGLGYGRLVAMKDGAALYGAFIAIVLVASKQRKPRDGHLTDTGRADGCPLTADDLAIMSKLPSAVIQRMLDATSCASIGWVEVYDTGHTSASEVPAECPPSALEGREGREEKYTASATNADFEAFWHAYPRKVGKTAAAKAWERAKSKPDAQTIIAIIERQKTWPEWKKDGGQYIPHPSTWLNGGRWEDQPIVSTNGQATINQTRPPILTTEERRAIAAARGA